MALVTDFLMPRLAGLDLAREVHSLRPEVPIALLTGYMEALPDETIRAAGIRRLVNKPATIVELGEALRALLAGAGVAGA